MIFNRTGIALFLVLFPLLVNAQNGRLSEKDVQRQGMYIEANQQRLLGNYAKAIKIFEDLLIEEAENDALNYELARTYEAGDELQSAIYQAKIAVALQPDNEWYGVYLADLYQKTGQDNEAAEVYENLVNAYPDRESFFYKWAYFLVRANRASQALKVYETMEDRFGMSEELSRRKHTLYLGVGDFKKAEKELVKLVELFPYNTEYLHLLAGFYEQMHEDNKARAVYARIIELDPNDSRAAIAVTDYENPASNDVNYLRSLQAIFVKRDVSLDVKMVQLIPFIQKVADTGDQDLANAALSLTAILDEIHPGEAKVHAAIGDLYYYSDQKDLARTYYEKALQEDESVYQVWEQYLYTCLETNANDKLLSYSESALDVFPNQVKLYYLNAIGYSRKGESRSAIAALEQALLMTGRNLALQLQVYHLLGKSYQEIGNYDRSGDAYSRALELDPNSAAVLTDFSYMLAMRGVNLGKAKEMAARANEIFPNNAQAQHTYGWVLYRLQEYKAAKDWIGRALKLAPEDTMILEHYGDVLYQLNEQEAAIRNWEQAAAKGGGSELLDRKIADGKLYE
ncbi:MAG: tetratricopeptide repeat protein [Saprospiraceae bacterium]|nr:tetratricopeptide repeat protein [Saprospiraceae bacterium]